MELTASKLRENIYRILDQILASGKPVEILRGGKRLRISPVEPPSKLSRLKKHKILVGDPEDIIHIDWSKEWKPTL